MWKLNLEKVRCRFSDGLVIFLKSFLAILFVAPAHAITCDYNPWAKDPIDFQIRLPANLTVPRDTPIGGTFLEYELTAPHEVQWRCSENFRSGMENLVGGSGIYEGKSDFPIGDTGLAWSFSRLGYDFPDISKGVISNVGGGGTIWVWPAGAGYVVRIKKIGQVKEGAIIPAGLLGRHTVERQIYPVTIRALTESSIGTGSCKTPGVTVKMGDRNMINQFKGVGTSLAPVNFSIALRECPEGISRVQYELKPNTNVVDAARSVVGLDAESTAKGVGLQLLDNGGNPIPLRGRLRFIDYDSRGGNVDIPLKAAYFQTDPVIVPGTANTSVTLEMTYD